MANGTFLSGLLNCLFEDFFTSKNISSNLQKITCITLNLQYIDVQGDSMYSILSIDATYFLNITKGHYPQRMPIIYKPRTRYNATSGIQSAITVADPPSGYGGQPHTMASQHYQSHSCVPAVCTGFAQGSKKSKQQSRYIMFRVILCIQFYRLMQF